MKKTKLIAVHINEAEQRSLLTLQGHGSIDKATGWFEFSALDEKAKDPKFKKQFIENYKALKKAGSKEADLIAKEIEPHLAPSFMSPGEKRGLGKKVAEAGEGKGKNKDNSIVLLPESLVILFLEAKQIVEPDKNPVQINPKTKLLEFFGPLALFATAIAVSALGNIAGGMFSASGARAQARAYERAQAANRDWQEKMMQRLGYFDEYKPDNRPRRLVLNPHYNNSTRNYVPAYLGTEFYDPRTNKAISGDEALKLKAERDKLRPDKANEMMYEYEPTPEEQKNLSAAQQQEMVKGLFLADRQQKNNEKNSLNLLDSKSKRIKGYLAPDIKPKFSSSLSLMRSPSEKSLAERVEEVDSSAKKGKFSPYATGGLISPVKSCGIKGKGDGQSDSIHTRVPAGSYIVDATTVAHLGNGSSSAGIKRLDEFTDSVAKRYMKALPSLTRSLKKTTKPVPVAIANEEYKVSPVHVAAIGNGSIDNGAKRLKSMVENIRKHKAQGGLALPPKARNIKDYIGA